MRTTRRLLVWILIASAIGFAIGCNAASKRPYAASEAVLTFENAQWIEVGGKLYLLSADWKMEKEMNMEDLRYNFRRGAVLTPGFLAKILDRVEVKP